jgi:hypothetical protein
LTALFGLAGLEHLMRKDVYGTLVIETTASAEQLAGIRAVLSEFDAEIRDMAIHRAEGADGCRIEFDVKLGARGQEGRIVERLARLEGTRRAQWV